ncbi:cyclic-phosphate processing receiver domain-containing protein [Paenibacillus gansuensis]|uniref:Cyclic-phosphate processing receiver domain-containing protein n=1 Tax=Paenibacillus gansuensis TaxID=306542 RepID=A0ABW5PAX1_9BACL
MIHLYMDDYRRKPEGFVLARTIDECMDLLEQEKVDILSLDYDLGWGEPNGLETVRRLLMGNRFPRKIYLHSSSIAGRKVMYEALYGALPESVELYMHPVPDALMDEIASKGAQGK